MRAEGVQASQAWPGPALTVSLNRCISPFLRALPATASGVAHSEPGLALVLGA